MTEFQDGAAWVLEKQQTRREIREKIHRAHLARVSEGGTYADGVETCMERFGDEYLKRVGHPLTERIISNIVSRPTGAVADSLTEALIVRRISALVETADQTTTEIDRQIEDIEGVDGWVEVEKEETTGGKFEGCKVKKVPVDTHRLNLLKRRVETQQQFFDAVKALLPKSNLNVFVKDGDVSVLTDADLDRQIERFKGKNIDITDRVEA